jgi:hypothetical protein
MQREPDNNSYSPDNLVVITVASCFSSILVVGLFYLAVSSELMLAFLSASAWVVVGNFSITVSLIPLRKVLRSLAPAWVVIPILGTFLSVFSFLLYVHWNVVSRYVPGDPFLTSPPPVSEVIWEAFKIILVLSFIAVIMSFGSLGAFQAREGSVSLDLN